MPIKPLSHLRPLLRLPTHPTPPTEHFTANPSLLHHLPQSQGAHANALATQAASAASSGGSGAGAGHRGWNAGGAGNQGGYTGYARAFLSLPQTVSLDPSASLTSNDETNPLPSQRSALLLRHRIASKAPTQIIQIPEDVPRRVKRGIESRAGTGKVGIVEIESTQGRDRRASIVFPTVRTLDLGGVSGPRTISPRSISRASSTVDLWNLAGSSPRPGLGVRALSTRSTSIPLPEVAVELDGELGVDEEVFVGVSVSRSIPSATPAFKQPNRVLMDLAGMVTPRRVDNLRVRRYSIAAVQQSETIPEVPEEENIEDAQSSFQGHGSDPQEMDKALFLAIVGARRSNNTNNLNRIIEYYRAPRDSPTLDPELAKTMPLTSEYSVRTYNLILETYLHNRQPGSSIAPVLETYNEMLDRDIIPNQRTYNEVIRALALREVDVQSAVERFEDHVRWARWRSENMDQVFDQDSWDEQRAVVEGYVAEGNLSSALRLFDASRGLRRDRSIQWGETLTGFHLPVLNALAAQKTVSNDDLEIGLQVFQDAGDKRLANRRALFGSLALILGKVGEGERGRLEGLWEEFMEGENEGMGEKNEVWGMLDTKEFRGRNSVQWSDARNYARLMRRTAWGDVGVALVRVGAVDKAKELVQRLLDGQSTSVAGVAEESTGASGVVEGLNAPSPTLIVYRILRALVEKGKLDDVKEVSDTTLPLIATRQTDSELRTSASNLRWLVGELVLSDQLEIAMDILAKYQTTSPAPVSYVSEQLQGARKILTLAVDAKIIAETNPVEVEKWLGQLNSIYSGAEKSMQGGSLDCSLALRHANALVRAGHGKEIVVAMENFYTSETAASHAGAIEDGSLDSYEFAERLIKDEKTPLQSVLVVLDRFAVHSVSVFNPDTRRSIVKRYLAERKDSSIKTPFDMKIRPRSWRTLMSCFAGLDAESLAEGEWDGELEVFMGDLAELSGKDHDYLEAIKDKKSSDVEVLRDLARLLVDRFGSERTKEFLKPILRESQLGAVLLDQTVALETSGSEADTNVQTPEASEMDSPALFRPVSPQYTPLEDTTLTTNRLIVSQSLSREIQKHTLRDPQITALQAYDLLESRLAHGETASPDTIARLLDNVGRTGLENEYKVHKLYALGSHIVSTLPPNARVQPWWLLENAMLIATCHLGYLEQAGLHRAKLVEAGYPPGADAYATMIACAKDTTDDALVARELWDESRAVGVKANIFLYNTIISKLSRARKADMALDLFRHMKAANVRPSSVTYGAVINACCRVGDAESAETLFSEMTASPNFKPRVPPFNTMMQFHLTTQPSRAKVLQYFQSLQSFNVPPSAHTYKLLLDTYATLPPLDLPTMSKVFTALCSDPYVDVQGTHWASLIAAHGMYGNDLPKAIEIFESITNHPTSRRRKAKRTQTPSANPITEPVVWEAILNVIAQRGDLNQLQSLVQQMQATGPQATAYVNNVLITGYSRLERIDLAREVFERMGDSVQGVAAPNNHPTLLTSSGHVKPSTVTNGPVNVVYREPSTYEAMVRAELKAGEKDRAEEILRRMEERRYPVAVYLKSRAVLDEFVMNENATATRTEGTLEEVPYSMFGPMEITPVEGEQPVLPVYTGREQVTI